MSISEKLINEVYGVPAYRKRHRKFIKFMCEENEKPTEAQIKAGNYKKEHFNWNGFSISIENKAGSYREGVDPNGNHWKSKIYYDYGYIRGTEAKDGDALDVFVGPNLDSEIIFVVNQTDDKDNFDEHKVMIGFDSKEEAEKAYLKNYEKNWNKYSSIISLTLDQFKDWVENKNIKKVVKGEIKEQHYSERKT